MEVCVATHTVLIGPQGGGKSTQMGFLEGDGYLAVVMSKVLGLAQQTDPNFKDIADRYMSLGMPVPNEFTMLALRNHLDKIPRGRNLVFDGFPRDVEQAKMLEGIFRTWGDSRVYIILDMTKEAAKARIAHRVQQMLRNEQEPRKDDANPVAVDRRLTAYFEQLKKLEQFFSSVQAPVFNINAHEEPERIGERIKQYTSLATLVTVKI